MSPLRLLRRKKTKSKFDNLEHKVLSELILLPRQVLLEASKDYPSIMRFDQYKRLLRIGGKQSGAKKKRDQLIYRISEQIKIKAEKQKRRLEDSRNLLKFIELFPDGKEIELTTIAEVTQRSMKEIKSLLDYLLKNKHRIGSYSHDRINFLRGVNINNYIEEAIMQVIESEKELEKILMIK